MNEEQLPLVWGFHPLYVSLICFLIQLLLSLPLVFNLKTFCSLFIHMLTMLISNLLHGPAKLSCCLWLLWFVYVRVLVFLSSQNGSIAACFFIQIKVYCHSVSRSHHSINKTPEKTLLFIFLCFVHRMHRVCLASFDCLHHITTTFVLSANSCFFFLLSDQWELYSHGRGRGRGAVWTWGVQQLCSALLSTGKVWVSVCLVLQSFHAEWFRNEW